MPGRRGIDSSRLKVYGRRIYTEREIPIDVLDLTSEKISWKLVHEKKKKIVL